jgi:hypothetical protein
MVEVASIYNIGPHPTNRNLQRAPEVTSSTLIPTYFDIFFETSWHDWHAGVESERFFDDSLQVFHLVQVLKCGRAVRTLKNFLQFFIRLVLEEDNIQSHGSSDRIIYVIPSENKNLTWCGFLITVFI